MTDIIVREADRLNGLVSNFLGLARNRPLEAGIVLVDECISETLDLLEQDGRQGLEIEREFTFRPGIRADRDRLRQVFWNLFNNAFEAMPEGGRLRVITDRAPGLDERGREILRIQIADTGDGIPASDVEQIFDPFYTRRSGGTGLGLAITRQIVSDHGGRISVSSTPGDGATFEILLPVAEGVARVGSERSVVVG